MQIRTIFSACCLILHISLCSSCVIAQNNPNSVINWQPWSASVFERAKNEHRLVFIYNRSEWCHWCHKMEDTTLKDPLVIKSINTDYIPVRLDIDKDAKI